MKLKNSPAIWLLGLISLLGLGLRFYRLADFPVSLNWDEVSHAYNAYSLLLTGRDEWGTAFPHIFRAFGDYKLPLYIYLTTLPVKVFGLTAFATRFLSALAGSLAIPGIFLLTNQIFPGKIKSLTLGHLAAFLLALSPWHFFISRPALEANLALGLYIFGLFALLKGLEKPKFLLLGSFLLTLTLHTYNSYRVLVPLLLLCLLLIYRKRIHLTSYFYVSLAIFLAGLTLVIYQTLTGSGTARYSKLALLSESTVYQIGQDRINSRLPGPLPILIHNRPVYISLTFAKNYLSYFTPTFLYQKSGAQSQFAIPGQNLLGLPTTLLALFGLFLLRRHSLVLTLLLLSPIAAALTADPPQALRPTPLLVPLILLAAAGSDFLLHKLHQKKTFPPLIGPLLFVLLITLPFARYAKQYLTTYAATYSQSWQYGYKQAVQFVTQNSGPSDTVFFTKYYGEPHIFYAFYSQLHPSLLQPTETNIRFAQSDWFWTDKIGNVYFVNDWLIPHNQVATSLHLESGKDISTQGALIVTTPNSLPSNTNILKRITRPDGSIAFVVAKFK